MKKTSLFIVLLFAGGLAFAGEGHWQGLSKGDKPHGKSGCEFSKEKMAKIHGKDWKHSKKQPEAKVDVEKTDKEPTLDQFI